MAKLSNQELYSTTIKKVVNKELTQKEASIKLGISDRQIRRIVTKYKKLVMMHLFIKIAVNLVTIKKSQMT